MRRGITSRPSISAAVSGLPCVSTKPTDHVEALGGEPVSLLEHGVCLAHPGRGAQEHPELAAGTIRRTVRTDGRTAVIIGRSLDASIERQVELSTFTAGSLRKPSMGLTVLSSIRRHHLVLRDPPLSCNPRCLEASIRHRYVGVETGARGGDRVDGDGLVRVQPVQLAVGRRSAPPPRPGGRGSAAPGWIRWRWWGHSHHRPPRDEGGRTRGR